MTKRSSTLTAVRARPAARPGRARCGSRADAPDRALADAEHAGRARRLDEPDPGVTGRSGSARARAHGRRDTSTRHRRSDLGRVRARVRGVAVAPHLGRRHAGRDHPAPARGGGPAARLRAHSPGSLAPGHGSATRAASTSSLRSGVPGTRRGRAAAGAGRRRRPRPRTPPPPRARATPRRRTRRVRSPAAAPCAAAARQQQLGRPGVVEAAQRQDDAELVGDADLVDAAEPVEPVQPSARASRTAPCQSSR